MELMSAVTVTVTVGRHVNSARDISIRRDNHEKLKIYGPELELCERTAPRRVSSGSASLHILMSIVQ